MARVEVSRLTMACPVQHSAAPRIRLEDALQCELPDDDRLVLIRRMAIAAGGSAVRPGQRQQALRSAWQSATDDARHGSESGAPNANCVWFASEAEAEIVLLDLLLRGCAPVGWFWKLAVPKWRGRPVDEWLHEVVADAVLPGREAQLVRLIACCVETGAISRLIAALLDGTAADNSWVTALTPEPTNPGSSDGDDDQTDLAESVASQVLRQFPDAVQDSLRAVPASSQGVAAVRAVLRAQALRVSPALAIRPLLLAEVVARAEVRLQSPATAAATPAREAKDRSYRANRSKRQPQARQSPDQSNPAPTPTLERGEGMASQNAGSAKEPAQQLRVDQREQRTMPDLIISRALRSDHAGVWLVVPAFADIGFPRWLRDHPELLGDHPGAQLITAIARHHGCAANDPALSGLPRLDPDQPYPLWTVLWRHALDRWLRRTARRRVHDLARRPGKLLWSDDRLQITFPLAAADIRLRRLALDRDPGWTDWLGLSVRFGYGDEVRR